MSARQDLSIHQQWVDFQQRMLAEGVSVADRDALRIAFFAGFTACLGTTMQISADGPVKAAEAMQLLRAESASFARSL